MSWVGLQFPENKAQARTRALFIFQKGGNNRRGHHPPNMLV